MDLGSPELDALVVLGCKVNADGPSGALQRRLERAKRALGEYRVALMVLSGGKRWGEQSEAEAMLAWLHSGRPDDAGSTGVERWRDLEVALENASLTTRENAREVAALLAARKLRHVGLVTCDFHMTRAASLFERRGLVVTRVPAVHTRSWTERRRLALKERGAALLSWFEKDPLA